MIYILGICGTFMAGVAMLAKQSGIEVRGCDSGIYPPMSTLLETLDIDVDEGYLTNHLDQAAALSADGVIEQIIVGNALSRGNPVVEAMLSRDLAYTSGPQWLGEQILRSRPVYAVAGTHGKTSTSSMLTWILESAGQQPGFLIGGKPGNSDQSARLGDADNHTPFVIEADEYDTAFFDKRSKFVHYRPTVAVLNNLEFDHADIFDSLADIKKQFHHLIRTISKNGLILLNRDDANLAEVLTKGVWTPIETFSLKNTEANWHATANIPDCSEFTVTHNAEQTTINWSCYGEHNMINALAAIAAARHAGVMPNQAAKALASFKLPAKRLQSHTNALDVHLYEDFAHHPTAIAITLKTLQARHPQSRIIAIVEPRSNTMRMGVHRQTLPKALSVADEVWFYQAGGMDWQLDRDLPYHRFDDVDAMLAVIKERFQPDDVVVVMSNGDFDGLVQKLTQIS